MTMLNLTKNLEELNKAKEDIKKKHFNKEDATALKQKVEEVADPAPKINKLKEWWGWD